MNIDLYVAVLDLNKTCSSLLRFLKPWASVRGPSTLYLTVLFFFCPGQEETCNAKAFACYCKWNWMKNNNAKRGKVSQANTFSVLKELLVWVFFLFFFFIAGVWYGSNDTLTLLASVKPEVIALLLARVTADVPEAVKQDKDSQNT